MADPEVSGNNTEYQKLVRMVSDMQDAVDGFARYKDLERQLAEAKELLKDSEGALPHGVHGLGMPRILGPIALEHVALGNVGFAHRGVVSSPAGDPEMAELARDEIDTLQAAIDEQGDELKFLLLPKDPLDEKNIMLEVGCVNWMTGLLEAIAFVAQIGWLQKRLAEECAS